MHPRHLLALSLLAGLGACDATGPELSPASRADGAAAGETVLGLTAGNQLVVVSSTQPNRTIANVQIQGLMAGEEVIGIDFRPSDLNGDGNDDVGRLYGVTDASRLVVIDPATGMTSAHVLLSTGLSSLVGGTGFNPVPDRLRIHTASDQNLRVNVDNGAVTVDGALRYGAGDVRFGVDPIVVATGYTNNDNDPATGTALYALDAATGSLVTFPAATGGPNGGVMATVGALGVSFGSSTGFDISLATGIGYAAVAVSPSGKSTLYAIDLSTGAATRLGLLAQTSTALLSIAVQP